MKNLKYFQKFNENTETNILSVKLALQSLGYTQKMLDDIFKRHESIFNENINKTPSEIANLIVDAEFQEDDLDKD